MGFFDISRVIRSATSRARSLLNKYSHRINPIIHRIYHPPRPKTISRIIKSTKKRIHSIAAGHVKSYRISYKPQRIGKAYVPSTVKKQIDRVKTWIEQRRRRFRERARERFLYRLKKAREAKKQAEQKRDEIKKEADRRKNEYARTKSSWRPKKTEPTRKVSLGQKIWDTVIPSYLKSIPHEHKIGSNYVVMKFHRETAGKDAIDKINQFVRRYGKPMPEHIWKDSWSADAYIKVKMYSNGRTTCTYGVSVNQSKSVKKAVEYLRKQKYKELRGWESLYESASEWKDLIRPSDWDWFSRAIRKLKEFNPAITSYSDITRKMNQFRGLLSDLKTVYYDVILKYLPRKQREIMKQKAEAEQKQTRTPTPKATVKPQLTTQPPSYYETYVPPGQPQKKIPFELLIPAGLLVAFLLR